MMPLDYYIRVRIEQKADTIARSMVKTNVIKHHKPDLCKWGKYVYDVLEPEFKQQKLEYRPEYCIWVKSVAGRGFINDIYGYRIKEVYFPLEFSSKIPWPMFFHIDGLVTQNMFDNLILHDNPVWYGLRDELAAYNSVVEKYTKPRRVFFDSVKKICAHYDTINEALAAWPAFRCLLPDYLQTQDLPFDGTPKPLPDDINIAELTALITRAKMEV